MRSDDLRLKANESPRTLLLFGSATGLVAILLILACVLVTSTALAQCGAMQHSTGGSCCDKANTATNATCPHHTSAGSATLISSNAVAIPGELAPVFERYAAIQNSLAADSIEGVAAAAGSLAKLMRYSGSGYLGQNAGTAEKLAEAKGLSTARSEFKTVSQVLIQYLAVTRLIGGEYHEAYCPMAKASWLQKGTKLENPYMGKEMLRCGQFKS